MKVCDCEALSICERTVNWGLRNVKPNTIATILCIFHNLAFQNQSRYDMHYNITSLSSVEHNTQNNSQNPLILLYPSHTIKPHHFITNLKGNRKYPLLLPTEENRKDCTHEHSSECWGCTQASASGTCASIRECEWHFGQWASKAVQAGAYAFNYWWQ